MRRRLQDLACIAILALCGLAGVALLGSTPTEGVRDSFTDHVAQQWSVLTRARAESGASAGSGGLQSVNPFDRQKTAWRFVGAGDAAQVTSTALSDAVTGGPIFDNSAGRQNLPVSGRFSNSGATITVCWIGMWQDPTTGNVMTECSDPVTLTASTVLPKDPNGQFVAPTRVLDTLGCRYGKLWVCTGPSAGTTYLYLGSY